MLAMNLRRKAGDVLFLATDGVTAATRAGEKPLKDRLNACEKRVPKHYCARDRRGWIIL